jgi:predicted nucleic acid-binding protein
MKTFIDTDILIWHLRGRSEARDFLAGLALQPETEFWIGAMNRAEILAFLKPGEEKATQSLLALFQTAPLDAACVDLGSQWFRVFHASHGVDLNDALLAATLHLRGGLLYTLNLKHYPFPDISARRGWGE